MKSREKLYRKCVRLCGPAADQMSAGVVTRKP